MEMAQVCDADGDDPREGTARGVDMSGLFTAEMAEPARDADGGGPMEVPVRDADRGGPMEVLDRDGDGDGSIEVPVRDGDGGGPMEVPVRDGDGDGPMEVPVPDGDGDVPTPAPGRDVDVSSLSPKEMAAPVCDADKDVPTEPPARDVDEPCVSPAEMADSRPRGSVADQEVPVSTELMQEAQQYSTVQTLQQWPVLTNTTTALLDGYHTLKKEGEVARVVLNASEELAGVVCQFAVLPVVRSPLVKTPLKMADRVSGKGAELLQKAIPRLTDTEKPLRLNAELLLSLLLVPLTLSVALGRDLMEFSADWLVSTFPGLRPAAKGFSEKSLLGQCGTLALMVGLYLPLQLVSQPTQTVRQLVAVPQQVAAAVISWVREAYAAVVDEVGVWTSWVGDAFVQAVSWVAATAQTAYYVVFVMTGLEPLLLALLSWARSLLRSSQDGARRLVGSVSEAAPISGLAERVASSDLAPVRFVRELWCGADSQCAEGDQRTARAGGGRAVGSASS